MTRLPAALLLLAACAPATGAGPSGDWALATLDGAPLGAPATLREGGDALSGQAPCNAWSASVEAGPGDAFVVGPVGGTEMACDALPAETRFYEALAQVTQRRQDGGTLTLAGPAHVLVFTR